MTSPARPLVESALLSALGALFILVAFYVPVLGVFATLVSPLPVAFAVIRHGIRWGVLSSVVTLIVLLPFLSPITAISLWVVYGTMGVALGYSVRRGLAAERTIGLMTGASLVGMAADLLGAYLVTGITLRQLSDQTIKMFTEAYELNKRLVGETPVLEEIMKTVTPEMVMRMLPAGFFMSSLFLAWLNYEVVRRVFPRFGYTVHPLRPFSRWIMPELAGHAWILGIIAFQLQPFYAERFSFLPIVVENVFLMAVMVLLIDAASALCFFFRRSGISGGMAGFFTLIALYMALTSPLIGLGAQIFGMIDVLFDLRKVRYPELSDI
ncbi:MAG: YybS family protein [Bacillota bacterium]|nr:DUF2232 domain-containing protein [Candidatus Fermentithermobacillaceae bacterium]